MAKSGLVFHFNIEGAELLVQVLDQLPKGVSKKILISTLKLTAKSTVKDARSFARKSDWDSKDMAKSIKSRTVKGRTAKIAVGASLRHFYDLFFERGFYTRQPEAFIKPSWTKNKSSFTRKFGENAWVVLEKFKDRLFKRVYSGKVSSRTRRILGL